MGREGGRGHQGHCGALIVPRLRQGGEASRSPKPLVTLTLGHLSKPWITYTPGGGVAAPDAVYAPVHTR